MGAEEDPRRSALLELRARQVLIFWLEDVDDGTGFAPLAAVLDAATAELGPDADEKLARRALGIICRELPPSAAAEIVARQRAQIPALLANIEGR